jgi:hypothetical protein
MGGPRDFVLDWNPNIFVTHARFWNPTTNPSERIRNELERQKREKNKT